MPLTYGGRMRKVRLAAFAPGLAMSFYWRKRPGRTAAVRLAKTVFPVERVFENTSYKDRYRILCQRLVRERLYDVACFTTSSRTPGSPIHQPDPELSFNALRAAIAGRAAFIKAL